ncbi:EF-hand domain-containing protein [Methylobacterium sp. NEAU K]|uniref:EF-hand domain-containing protein n=1 Tax=Methylobacterium sp. NEAU K TaxID=3064946 RepID=UPI00273456D2|nr:EF-hand domain-containing protein [Methylobacterium sp. NEAU K]MDP4003296.1 EF-hand domain-containing protein [Methylobacterium sp. NEAU K]
MTLATLMHVTALTTLLAAGSLSSARAQTSTGPMSPPDQSAQPNQSGMMGRGMMSGMGGMGQGGRHGMMGHMMDGMNRGMTDGGLRMRMMFAIADTDGDGSLSFEEVTAIHKRIFNAVDANKDGKVTPDEIRKFFEEP